MGDISIDDVVSNSKIFNDVASEYEMPGKLPKTNCNISMPSVKPSRSDGDKMCDTCNKEDVCMYKVDLAKAINDIIQISERTNVFIDTDIRCKKWGSKTIDFSQYPLCQIVKMGANPRCIYLRNDKYCVNENKCNYKSKRCKSLSEEIDWLEEDYVTGKGI